MGISARAMTIFIRLSNDMRNFGLQILDCGLKTRPQARAGRLRLIQNPTTRKRVPRIRNGGGFSLTEVLIVIALIVLILAMALPAFNFITGGRSVEAATNQISAMLSRARTEAIGLQEIRGVMFYIDPVTNRQMMTLVKTTPSKGTIDATTNSAVDTDAWLDVNSDEDHIPMPKGIGIQVTNDDTNAALQPDRYIGFNTYSTASNGLTIPIGGVILFDGYGRLANKHYGFRMTNNTASSNGAPSLMAQLLLPNNTTLLNTDDFCQLKSPNAPLSSFGFVLFEEDLMKDKFGEGYATDPTYSGANYNSSTEKPEEQWLDDNATAVLINRYNGTLVKGN
jgi:type II secretory pathway pseudopilin PulG